MVRGVVVTIIALASCVRTSAVECPDHSVCTDDRTCVLVAAQDRYACATVDEIGVCKDTEDGKACTVPTGAGTCFGGGCVLAVCGDGLVEGDEVCDDGNLDSGDGCAKDCLSTETCGNGVIDLASGEQCDEGDALLGGDGCSRACKSEYRIWRDVTPRAADARHYFGLVADLAHGVLMFGGAAPQSGGAGLSSVALAAFADTWRFDGVSWLVHPPLTTVIDRRADMAIANDRHGHIIEFAGASSVGNPQRDMMSWDGLQWRKLTPVTLPPTRSAASMACANGNNVECVLFGGSNAQNTLDDTWVWNGSSWTAPPLPVTRPPVRRHGQLVYDTANTRYLLFGGDAAGFPLKDLWAYKPAGNVWTLLDSGASLMASGAQAMAFDEVAGHAVLVLGNATFTFDAGVWKPAGAGPPGALPELAWGTGVARVIAVSPNLDEDQLMLSSFMGTTWQALSDQRPSAGPRRTAAAYDERRGVTVIADSNTWEWNGVGWTRTATATGIPSTDGAALVYDPVCHTSIEFGGGPISADGQRHNFTSRYPRANGQLGWDVVTLSPPDEVPSPRSAASMTYDHARNAIVLFGGYVDDSTIGGDTWELTTTDCATWKWTPRETGGAPPGRWGASLTYDHARGTSVLFGGRDATGNDLSDTWSWDGTTWTRLAPPVSPPARTDAMVAWDPRRRSILLFGGRQGDDTRLNDTWEWNGKQWDRLAPAIVPGARAGAGFALDITGNLVSFHGENAIGGAIVNITRLSSELSTEPRETCDVPADADGDGLVGCADPDCWSRCTPSCAPGETCTPDTKCGDGTCDPVEDYVQCPADCPIPPL